MQKPRWMPKWSPCCPDIWGGASSYLAALGPLCAYSQQWSGCIVWPSACRIILSTFFYFNLIVSSIQCYGWASSTRQVCSVVWLLSLIENRQMVLPKWFLLPSVLHGRYFLHTRSCQTPPGNCWERPGPASLPQTPALCSLPTHTLWDCVSF